MKIFNVKVSDHKIQAGYKLAETVLQHEEFHKRFSLVDEFTYTHHSREMVVSILKLCLEEHTLKLRNPIQVMPYYYRNPDVIGRAGEGLIEVNTNGIRYKSVETFFLNGLHEFGHYPLGYSHGSNFPPGSWRGRMLGDWQDKTKSVCHTLERVGLEFAHEYNLL